MPRFLILHACAVLLLAPAVAHSADANSALGVLQNLPAAYRNGVVWVSADNASPNPGQWYITARNASREGLLMNLTISGGRIVSERIALSPRAFLRQIVPMNLRDLRINSTDLWRTAGQFAKDRGRRLGSMSLQLQQHGRRSSPLWSVWCYDRSGRYIGFFSALATTGSITSSH